MLRRRFTQSIVAIAGGLFTMPANGEENQPPSAPQPPPQPQSGRALPNVVTPTFGGKQFWADELFFHDWHIQHNALTGHYRLLDGRNRRHAWGTFDQCQAKLDDIKRKQNLPPMQGPAVVVLHGLGRNAGAMVYMAKFLQEKSPYTVFNVTYPTTRGSVETHAQTLDRIVSRLDGIDEINFVAHSLGNLVIRHWLADHTRPELGQCPDPRVRRIVMLGPPNNGARLAEVLGRTVVVSSVFGTVVGKSGTQLASTWKDLEARLCIPRCEFAVIAGGRGGPTGYNPLLAGDNDLIVTVESAKLPGAKDFAVLPVFHTTMMDDPKVQEYTLRFLQHGHLIAPEKCQPIPAAVATQ
jgi:pimeloyl-ACP methyl ester carboxylesterase